MADPFLKDVAYRFSLPMRFCFSICLAAAAYACQGCEKIDPFFLGQAAFAFFLTQQPFLNYHCDPF
jgi:hypothetical protein